MSMDISTCNIGGIDPVLLPLYIGGNQVSARGPGTAYGIAATLGQPRQFFSLLPIFNVNNTFVVNADHCKSETNYSCIALNGGVYNPPDDVQIEVDPVRWNGTSGMDVVVGNDYQEKLYNDRLGIGDNEIFGFPFYTGSDNEGSTDRSALALGLNSSFIRAALETQMIGTKAWSYWPGNKYLGLDGLLILGGYDEARVGSDFATYKTEERYNGAWPATTYLEIKGLEWEYNPGNSTNLMPSDATTIGATLEPYWDAVYLPTASMDIIAESFESTYNSTIGTYMFEDFPVGNLIVTLVDDTRTIIPADDLFDYPTYYDDQGTETYSYSDDYSYLYASKIFDTSDYAGDYLLTLGLPFLSQKVIVADFDNGEYHMADAVKHDLGSGARSLKPLCTGGALAGSSNKTEPIDPKLVKKSTNVGAIAGGVVGSVAGLIIIALIAFFVLRRRKQKQSAEDQQQIPYLPEVTQTQYEPPHRGSTISPPPKYMTSRVCESGVDSQQPQRHRSPPPHASQLYAAGSELPSPGSESREVSKWAGNGGTGADARLSQVGVNSVGSNHEMSSENRFTPRVDRLRCLMCSNTTSESTGRLAGRQPEFAS